MTEFEQGAERERTLIVNILRVLAAGMRAEAVVRISERLLTGAIAYEHFAEQLEAGKHHTLMELSHGPIS